MIIRFPRQRIENLSNGDNRIRCEFNTIPERDHRCNIHDSARDRYICVVHGCVSRKFIARYRAVHRLHLLIWRRSRERLSTRNARVNCRVKCFGILIYHLRSMRRSIEFMNLDATIREGNNYSSMEDLEIKKLHRIISLCCSNWMRLVFERNVFEIWKWHVVFELY